VLAVSAGSANELFTSACQSVLTAGTTVSPRGIATLEVLSASLTLTDPRRRLVDVPPARVLNPAFAAAEAVWILSGSDDPWICTYNERLADYTDNGRFMGAYGPRLRHWHGVVDQLDHVRQVLIKDPQSRQAVIQLFDPAVDFQGHKDVPCTLGYRFFLRDELLHMHTTMRSQDLWRGFCYDIFAATMLQELLAGWLNAGLGSYRHFADSLHLYASDVPAARRLPAAAMLGGRMTSLAAPWEEFDDLLAAVLGDDQVPGASWTEIAGVMASYRTWKAGHRERAQAAATRLDGPLAAALYRWYQRLSGDRQHKSAMTAGG
jgi:thymidylate synthase